MPGIDMIRLPAYRIGVTVCAASAILSIISITSKIPLASKLKLYRGFLVVIGPEGTLDSHGDADLVPLVEPAVHDKAVELGPFINHPDIGCDEKMQIAQPDTLFLFFLYISVNGIDAHDMLGKILRIAAPLHDIRNDFHKRVQ